MVSNEIENFSLPHSTPPHVVTAGISFFIFMTNHHNSQLHSRVMNDVRSSQGSCILLYQVSKQLTSPNNWATAVVGFAPDTSQCL